MLLKQAALTSFFIFLSLFIFKQFDLKQQESYKSQGDNKNIRQLAHHKKTTTIKNTNKLTRLPASITTSLDIPKKIEMIQTQKQNNVEIAQQQEMAQAQELNPELNVEAYSETYPEENNEELLSSLPQEIQDELLHATKENQYTQSQLEEVIHGFSKHIEEF